MAGSVPSNDAAVRNLLEDSDWNIEEKEEFVRSIGRATEDLTAYKYEEDLEFNEKAPALRIRSPLSQKKTVVDPICETFGDFCEWVLHSDRAVEMKKLVDAVAKFGPFLERFSSLRFAKVQEGKPDGNKSGSSSGSSGSSSIDSSSGASSDDSSGSDSSSEEEEEPRALRIVSDMRTVDVQLSSINEYITCSICNGYFRDAVTISECLCSFCKVCATLHIRNSCPRCGTGLQASGTSLFRPDHTKQAIVYKLLPQFKPDNEKDMQEQFYKNRGIKRKSREMSSAGKAHVAAQGQDLSGPEVCFELKPDNGETGGSAGSDLPAMPRSFVRVSGQLRVTQLRKYIGQSLGLQDSSTVEILCNGIKMGPEYTLDFISRTQWHRKDELKLFYRRARQPLM